MTAIPREYRRTISEAELYDTCAMFNIGIRKAGVKYWFVDLDFTTRPNNGEAVTPIELAEYVYRKHLDRNGEPILRIVVDERHPARLGLAYTPAGKRWRAEQLKWARTLGQSPRRKSARARTPRKVDTATSVQPARTIASSL